MLTLLLAQAPENTWTWVEVAQISAPIVGAVSVLVAVFVPLLMLKRNTQREHDNLVRQALAEFVAAGLTYLKILHDKPEHLSNAATTSVLTQQVMMNPFAKNNPVALSQANDDVKRYRDFISDNEKRAAEAERNLLVARCKLYMLAPNVKMRRDVGDVWRMITATTENWGDGEGVRKDMNNRIETLDKWILRIKRAWILEGAKPQDIELTVTEGGSSGVEVVKAPVQQKE